MVLNVTNGDAVVGELAAAAEVEPGEVLVWREILHDGPVPAGLGPAELARVRARHLAVRGWGGDDALAGLRERDERLAAHPPDGEIVLWFEEDLYDRLLLAQVEDRLAGRPGPVSRVYLPHPPRGDLRAALAARAPIVPDPAAFAALRSPDPRAWLDVAGFERLLEELPDVRTGLGRTERQILEALAAGPLAAGRLVPRGGRPRGPAVARRRHRVRAGRRPRPLVALAGRPLRAHGRGRSRPGRRRRPPADRPLARRRPPRTRARRLGLDPASGRPIRLD